MEHQDHYVGKRQQRRSKWRLTPSALSLAALLLLCGAALVWDLLDNSHVQQPARASSPTGELSQSTEATGINTQATPTDPAKTEPATAATAADGDGDGAALASIFAAYRLDREAARAEELVQLQAIIDDQASSEPARTAAEERRLQVAVSAGRETQAESLLDAAGFGETVVLLGEGQATAVVAVELDAVKATRIAELVASACCINFENVVIVNR